MLHGNGFQEKLKGFDYYFFDGMTIRGSDERPSKGLVKIGTLIPDDQYAAIIDGLESNSEIWNS